MKFSARLNQENLWRRVFSLIFYAFLLTVFTNLFVLHTAFAASGINKQINFQGKLVDNNGLNVADNTYTVVFSLYTVSSGGAATWTETDSVTTTNGVFQVALGAGTALPGNVDFNQDTWYLGIKVGADAEMAPRVRFAAVPYAFTAASLDGIVATNSAGQFTISGSTNSLQTLTVNGSLTLGSTITPTAAGALTVQSNGTNGLTLDTGGAAAMNIGTTANSITFGAINNPTYSFNGTGAFTVAGGGSNNITFGSSTGNGTIVMQPNAGGQAALIIKDQGLGDIFTASAGAITRFIIANNGNITDSSATAINFSGATLTVASCSGCGSGSNFWQEVVDASTGSNVLSPATSQLADSLSFGVTGSGTNVVPYSGLYIEPPQNTKGNALVAFNQTGLGDIFTASIGAATKFVIDKGGNVGIGVSVPGAKLQVAGGNILVDNNKEIDFYDTDGISIRTVLSVNSSGNTFLRSANSAGRLDIRTQGNNNSLSIDSTGKVGIGTFTSASSPLASLDVRPFSGTIAVASISGQTSFAGMVVDQSGVGDIFTASSSGLSRFTIAKTGAITGSNWSITGAGALTVASCSGCGGVGSNFWQEVADPSTGLNVLSPASSQMTDGLSFGVTGSGTNVVPYSGLYIEPPANTKGNALVAINQTGLGDIFTASGSGSTRLTISNTNSGSVFLGGTTLGTSDFAFGNFDSGTPTATFSGDLIINSKPTTANSDMQKWTKITGTAGTIGGGTAGVASISASVVYNGSLYVGTNNPNNAEIYRYDGDALGTWTKISGTAGTVGGNATTGIDMISSLTVYNGYLYAGTTEPGKAEVYRYEGGTTWTELNPTGTAGKFLTTTAINGVPSMSVFGGRLFIGTANPTKAEMYMYNGGTTWIAVNSTAGTFVATNSIGVDAITQMVVINNQLVVGTLKTGDADVLRWNGVVGGANFFALNLASTTGSYLIDNAAQTGTTEITAMTVWAGKLIVAIRRGAGQADILMYQEPPGGAAPINSWTRLNSAAGTIQTASIDSVTSLAIYNGRLYAGTNKLNSGEIYRYDGEKSWTKVSQNTAGQIASGGTTAIDAISTLISYNNSLFAGTLEGTSAEGYSYTSSIDQSYSIKFDANATQGGGVQNNNQNMGQIFFVASLSANVNNKAGNTGTFVFSNSITTNNGSYDVAEDYPTRDDTIEPGDVVSIDTNERGFVKKSQGAYDYTAIGVYSEKPAMRLSQNDALISGGIPIPIALAGRVPVKVSTENGDIQAGDPLTPSSTPGVAMKAKKSGLIIGEAMESFSSGGVGKVLAYIKSTSYEGSIAQNFTSIVANSATFGSDILTALASQATSASGSSIVTDRLVAGLEIVTPKITTDTLIAKKIDVDQIIGLNEKITSLLSPSAVASTDAILNSVTVNGLATISANLRVKSDSLFEGMVHVVDTLMANNIIVNGISEFFNNALFHKDIAVDGHISVLGDTAGTVIISQGQKKAAVVFGTPYPSVPVVTASLSLDETNATNAASLETAFFANGYSYVITQQTENGFTILLNKPATNDVTFTWTALGKGDSIPTPTQ